MAGRLAGRLLAACCLLLFAETAWSQATGGYGDPRIAGVYGAGGAVGQPTMLPAQYAAPAGPVGGPDEAFSPAYVAGPEGISYTNADGTALYTVDRVGDEPGWFYASPLDRIIADTVKGSWFRITYLHWKFERPGNEMLGAPIDGIPNARDPFDLVIDPATGNVLTTARVFDLRDFSLRNNQGIKGTLGIPFAFGEWESSVFTFEKASHFSAAGELPSDPTLQPFPVIITTLLDNGNIRPNPFPVDDPALIGMPIYDVSFDAKFVSEFWGAESNLVFDLSPYGPGLHFKPLFGFQFFALDEQLLQQGVFDNLGTQPPNRSVIDAKTRNRLYVPQAGLRIELQHPMFVIGVEPKVGLGANRFLGSVRTDNLRGPLDPTVITEDQRTIYSAVFQLRVYAQIHVNDYFSLFVAYNFLHLDRVTRPHDNIFYNDTGPLDPPAVVQDTYIQDFKADGLVVGGELRFR